MSRSLSWTPQQLVVSAELSDEPENRENFHTDDCQRETTQNMLISEEEKRRTFSEQRCDGRTDRERHRQTDRTKYDVRD